MTPWIRVYDYAGNSKASPNEPDHTQTGHIEIR
jgi:hypothetical protein